MKDEQVVIIRSRQCGIGEEIRQKVEELRAAGVNVVEVKAREHTYDGTRLSSRPPDVGDPDMEFLDDPDAMETIRNAREMFMTKFPGAPFTPIVFGTSGDMNDNHFQKLWKIFRNDILRRDT